MTRPFAWIVVATIVLAMLAFTLGFAAERLGSWTDAHPERAVLAWSLWNAGLLIVAVASVVVWRRYRRATKEQSATPAA